MASCFVHPQGICDSKRVGAGTRIWAFAHVLAGARIGRDCNICDHVFVENDEGLTPSVTWSGAVSGTDPTYTPTSFGTMATRRSPGRDSVTTPTVSC